MTKVYMRITDREVTSEEVRYQGMDDLIADYLAKQNRSTHAKKLKMLSNMREKVIESTNAGDSHAYEYNQMCNGLCNKVKAERGQSRNVTNIPPNSE